MTSTVDALDIGEKIKLIKIVYSQKFESMIKFNKQLVYPVFLSLKSVDFDIVITKLHF